MEKIFEHADDLHVVARKIYIKPFDDYVYSDRERIQKIDAKTLIDLFVKGVIIVAGEGVFIKPFSCINYGDFTEIVCQDLAEGGIIQFYSKEYVKPLISLAIAPEDSGTELLGKLARDLQTDVVVEGCEVIGTLHHVTGYTGFSGNADMQSGNYIALKFAITPADAVTTVEVVGGTSGPATLDSDLNAVLKISDIATQQIRVISQKAGYQTKTVTLDISGLTCESATLTE